MYQALYRKWRPKTFDDVIGQEHITETLKRQVDSGRLSHAYLFVGTRGTGKTTCAKILSKAVNCEHPENGNPCNKCPSCLGIDSGSILDVTEMDAASNNGVDDIRALRDEAIYSPSSVKSRVYIIDEVHMLSKPAFNALLKILEEPPKHLIFILATTELNKVPATILSRCQRFSFKRLLPADIISRLKYVASQENIDLTDDGAELLAHMADGAMRDALSLLDQCGSVGHLDADFISESIGLAGSQDTITLLRLIESGDIGSMLKKLDELYKNGKDMNSALDELSSLVRDVLLYKLSPSGSESLISGLFDTDTIKNLSKDVSVHKAIFWLDTMNKSSATLNNVSSVRLGVELCLISMCGNIPADSAEYQVIENVKEKVSPVTSSSLPKGKTIQAKEITAPAQPEKNAVSQNEPAGIDDSPIVSEQRDDHDIPPASPKEGNNDSWSNILAEAKNCGLDDGYYFVLADKSQYDVEISAGKISVGCKNPFTESLINNPQINPVLRKAANKVLGSSMIIVGCKAVEKNTVSSDKLDALSKFDIIKFE